MIHLKWLLAIIIIILCVFMFGCASTPDTRIQFEICIAGVKYKAYKYDELETIDELKIMEDVLGYHIHCPTLLKRTH